MSFRFQWGLVCLAIWAVPGAAQTIAGSCPVFPSNNIWNARVDTAPLHPQSASWVTSIGAAKPLHQDFGGTLYLGNETGFRINLVPGSQPKVPIVFREGASESDPGPYPIPAAPYIENGSDAHMLLLDTDNCILYETFDTYKNTSGVWTASSGAIFRLRENALRPEGWTSADAAGLPIMPGLARYEEILEGEIKHALRFTAPSTRREYLWPGRHFASYSTSQALPPMGARFRLKANFDISPFSPTMRIILTALKRYGMMLADNGGSWFMQGTFDPRWPDLVTEFRKVPGSAFEAVDVSALMEDSDSAAVRAPATAPSIESAALASSSVAGGQPTSLRINLTGLAPAGGTPVSLSSSNSAAAQIAAAALVPAGSSFADVPVSTSGVSASASATLSATVAGVTRSATLTVTPPSVSLLTINPASVASGGSATAALTLSGNAPAGGLTVSITVSGSALALVPGSVLVPANQRTANFAVTARTVSVDTVVRVTAAALSSSASANLQIIAPPPPALTISSVSVAGAPLTAGQSPASAAFSLNAAAAAATAVTLTSSNPAVASVSTGSVTVSAGATGAGFSVTPLAAGTTVITAALGASSASFTLTVNAPATPPPASSGVNGTEFFTGIPLSQYSTRTNFTGWAGIGIVSRSRFKVTRLGRMRTGGQTGLRTVALFTSWGATTPAASVQVDLGSVPDGQFAYADIPGGGHQMEPDHYLYIVSQETAGQPVLWTSAAGVNANAASVAAVDRAAWKTANYDGFVPDNGVKLPHGAVNFQFTTGTVTQPSAPTLAGVSVSVPSVTAGGAVTGTVSLSSPAPANTTVTLGVTGPATLASSSVTVLSGQTSATFPVTAASVSTASTAVVQAALNAVSRTASLTVNPAPAAPPSAGTEFYTGLPLSQYTTRSNFTGWAGMGFTSTQRFRITRLGRMRTGGQTGMRTIGIFTSWGAQTPAVTVQVDLGSVPDGQFAYADIPGGYQLAGPGYYFYVVSQETAGQPVMWTTSTTATANTGSVAIVDRAAWKTANYYGFVPDGGVKLPHGTVNFQYTVQ